MATSVSQYDPQQVGLFEARNLMFIPIERVTEPPNPPAVPYRGLVVLTGVVRIDLQGNSVTAWRAETYQLNIGEDFGIAINDGPYKPQPGSAFEAHVYKAVPFATVSSRYNAGLANNDGTAVDRFRFSLPSPSDAILEVDLAVRDDDAHIYRIGYEVNLYVWLEEVRETTP
jgi:hypothetical protein